MTTRGSTRTATDLMDALVAARSEEEELRARQRRLWLKLTNAQLQAKERRARLVAETANEQEVVQPAVAMAEAILASMDDAWFYPRGASAESAGPRSSAETPALVAQLAKAEERLEILQAQFDSADAALEASRAALARLETEYSVAEQQEAWDAAALVRECRRLGPQDRAREAANRTRGAARVWAALQQADGDPLLAATALMTERLESARERRQRSEGV